jgi:hypothetical protein
MMYIVKSLLYYNILYSALHVLTFETHHQGFELIEMKTIDWHIILLHWLMPMMVIFRSRNMLNRIQYIVIEAAFYNMCYYSCIWRLYWFPLGLNWLRVGSNIGILWPWCSKKQYESRKFLNQWNSASWIL